jgi:ABC-type uncharacterized transport system auxiliary subunit
MLKRMGLILLMVCLSGCLRGTTPPPLIIEYVIEYPPPVAGKVTPKETMLSVDRFSVDRIYMGTAMLYRKTPFQREAYNEHRWRVSPSDMVTDFLRRDLRKANLFKAILYSRDTEEGRFVLQGGVEEFLEIDEGKGHYGLLVATVTLLDLSSRDSSRRMVMQKTYRCEAPFSKEGAPGFAEAMSRAMSQFSAQVIADIDDALKKSDLR